jgi:hypothetical protein
VVAALKKLQHQKSIARSAIKSIIVNLTKQTKQVKQARHVNLTCLLGLNQASLNKQASQLAFWQLCYAGTRR